MPREKGFTLIELLIVIILIAILATIGYSVYSSLGLQAKARNDKRKTDIDSIAKALEVNKTEAGYRALAPNQFSAEAIPQIDPSGTYYCGNVTANSQPNTPTINWTTSCGSNIPGGAWRQISGTSGPDGAIPPTGTSWKICAWLEAEANPNADPRAYCRISAQ